jgi:hypothetical protein
MPCRYWTRLLLSIGLCVCLLSQISPPSRATAQALTCQSNVCTYLPLINWNSHSTVFLRSWRSFIGPPYGDRLRIVGEIENGGTETIYYVQVLARLYDENGIELATGSNGASLPSIYAGMRTPFEVPIDNPPTGIAYIGLYVSYMLSSPLNWVCLPITVLSQQTRNNIGLEVFGEVRNPHARELFGIFIVFTFYTSDGLVYDVGATLSDIGSLQPGETTTYKLRTFKTNLLGVPFTVQAEGCYIP